MGVTLQRHTNIHTHTHPHSAIFVSATTLSIEGSYPFPWAQEVYDWFDSQFVFVMVLKVPPFHRFYGGKTNICNSSDWKTLNDSWTGTDHKFVHSPSAPKRFWAAKAMCYLLGKLSLDKFDRCILILSYFVCCVLLLRSYITWLLHRLQCAPCTSVWNT